MSNITVLHHTILIVYDNNIRIVDSEHFSHFTISRYIVKEIEYLFGENVLRLLTISIVFDVSKSKIGKNIYPVLCFKVSLFKKEQKITLTGSFLTGYGLL
jgi:hypothetical protein